MTCNCGTAIRYYDDLIEFNCCNDIMQRDETTPIIVKTRDNKCLKGISIKRAVTGILNVQYEVSLLLARPKLLRYILSYFWVAVCSLRYLKN